MDLQDLPAAERCIHGHAATLGSSLGCQPEPSASQHYSLPDKRHACTCRSQNILLTAEGRAKIADAGEATVQLTCLHRYLSCQP